MTARAFADHELAARAWWYLSPHRGERAIAARRFRELADLAHPDTLLQIVGELALEGYHAHAITRAIALDRAQNIDRFAPSDSEGSARVRAVLADLARRLHL